MDKEIINRFYDPKNCQKLSMLCQNALRILEEVDIEESLGDINWWLEEYDYLYRLLTNKPFGLPAIPRTSCDNIRYPELREFWKKYDRLKFPKNYHCDLEDNKFDGGEDNIVPD